jgi:hypothetical protein
MGVKTFRAFYQADKFSYQGIVEPVAQGFLASRASQDHIAFQDTCSGVIHPAQCRDILYSSSLAPY